MLYEFYVRNWQILLPFAFLHLYVPLCVEKIQHNINMLKRSCIGSIFFFNAKGDIKVQRRKEKESGLEKNNYVYERIPFSFASS